MARLAFQEYAKPQTARKIFSRYRWHIRAVRGYRQKTETPVNAKNGKPLNYSTLNSYKSKLRRSQKEVEAFKLAIRMLKEEAFFRKALS